MHTPGTVDRDLAAMMSTIFARHRDRHESDGTVAVWDPGLWAQLAELGLTRLTGREEFGGSGAGWFEAAELLRAAASHGVRVPIVEHDLLAGWLLDTAGLPSDGDRRTVCVLDDDGVGRQVPWAAQADKIVIVWRTEIAYLIADLLVSALHIKPGVNLAGEPRDTVTVDLTAVSGTPVADAVVDQLRLRGALARGLQICAALDRILDLSVTHTTQRTQFGRPLAKFQAVQHLVAEIAAEVSLARAATEAALAEAVRTDWTGTNLDFLVAVARSCAGHATSVVVRNAHQVHGAIGTTLEHRLHEYTTPALAWRAEYGSTRHWDNKLTDAALAAGSDGLWPLLTT